MSAHLVRVKRPAVAGDLNTLVAGTTTSGGTLETRLINPGSLSALFVVDAETNTITITCLWQVSDDGSTWYDLLPQNGASLVARATGTAGADASVSEVLMCPAAAEGWVYVRPAVRNAVATGAAADTYSIQSHYTKRPFEF